MAEPRLLEIPLRRLLLAGLAAALAACAQTPPGCRDATVSRLYLGRDSPRGDVAEAAWDDFVAEVVSPRFPAGFTTFDARGQWRADNGQLLHEASRVVEVVHDGDAAALAAIDAIGAEYRRRFDQEAVLVTHGALQSCLQFSR